MPLFSKALGPFASTQHLDDSLKKKSDTLLKESEKVIKNIKLKNRDEKLKELFASCLDQHNEACRLISLVKTLAVDQEPKPIKDFDKKKDLELKKLELCQSKLDKLKESFPPKLKEVDSGDEIGDNIEKESKDSENVVAEGNDAINVDEGKADEKSKDKKKNDDEKEDTKKGDTKGDKKDDKKKKSEGKKGDEKKKEIKYDNKKEKEKKNDGKKSKEDKNKKHVEIVVDEKKDDIESEEETGDEDTTTELPGTDKTEDVDEEDRDENDDKDEEDEDDYEESEDEEKEEIKPQVAKPASQTKSKESHLSPKQSHEKITASKSSESLGKPPTVSITGKSLHSIVKGKRVDPPKINLSPAEEDSEEDYEEDDEEDETEDEEGDEDEDEDDDEEDNDEHENDAETTTSLPSTMREFEAISDHTGTMNEDLSFKKGEILTIINTLKSDWWEAINAKGDKGLVPRNFLKVHKKQSDSKQDEDEDDEEEDEEEDDEEMDEEDEDEEGLEETTEESVENKGELKRSRSATDNWEEIKKSITETSISDVLHAMGAVPSGFRPSTLAARIMSDESYRMVHHLAPRLTPSNLTYSDLRLDVTKNKIKAHPVRVERVARIRWCKQIPGVGAGMEVLSRHVRACLFDGENIVSNIHCVKVAAIDKTQKTWTFNSKVTETMDTQQHSDIFLRTNCANENIGVLFELCVTCCRTSTDETGEVSCGWVHIPLVDETTGQVSTNKNYEIQVSGGTPYEDGVEVDPSINRRASSSVLVTMLSGNKQPMLSVRIINPTPEQKDLLQTLPDTLVGNASLLQFYSFYRQLLSDALLRDRLDLDSTEAIHGPVLVNFPYVADQHDLMDMFRAAWIDRQRLVRRREKDPSTLLRDEEYMKELFCEVFMETCYPFINISNLPPYHTAYLDSDKTRVNMVHQLKVATQHNYSALALLCSPEYSFTPFTMAEVSYQVLGPHCLHQHVYIESN